MAALGERVVLAWSDHRGGENRVFSAAVDGAGKIVAPAAPATPPLGEQAVLRVVAPAEGSQRAYLAWESLDALSRSHRSFQIAEFQPNVASRARAAASSTGRWTARCRRSPRPARGVAVLTARAAVRARRGVHGERAHRARVRRIRIVIFAIRSSEPLWPTNNAAPVSLAWNLTCPDGACFALGAESGVPSRVALARLEHRSDVYRAPAQRVELQAPRAHRLQTLRWPRPRPLSQVALTTSSAGTLLGWITDFDPTTPWVKLSKPSADGRLEPLRARIDLQAFADGEPFSALGASETLVLARALVGRPRAQRRSSAKRAARGLGGLGRRTAAGVPDPGRQGRQKAGPAHADAQKTGDLSDIAIRAQRQRLLAGLGRRAQPGSRGVRHQSQPRAESRLPRAAHHASARRGHRSVARPDQERRARDLGPDARESELPGAADIYSAVLRGSDANRSANEVCLLKSRPHSFAPTARAYGTGALVAWLEAASDNAQGEPAHVAFAVLDDAGQSARQRAERGRGRRQRRSRSASIAQSKSAHAIVAVDEDAHGALYAITVKERPVRRTPCASAAATTRPRAWRGVSGNQVYVSDVAQGLARLRRLQLEW